MQAFPWDTAPSYLLRDRDRVYGKTLRTLAAEIADHGSAHGYPISLAEPICRKTNRFDSPRMFGSCDCHERVLAGTADRLLPGLLSRLAESSFAWEGLSRWKSGGTAGTGPNCRRAESRRASPSIPTPSRLNSLPPMNLRPAGGTQLAWGCTGGATLTDRAPRPWSPDKVSPWLIVGSSTSRNGSV